MLVKNWNCIRYDDDDVDEDFTASADTFAVLEGLLLTFQTDLW